MKRPVQGTPQPSASGSRISRLQTIVSLCWKIDEQKWEVSDLQHNYTSTHCFPLLSYQIAATALFPPSFPRSSRSVIGRQVIFDALSCRAFASNFFFVNATWQSRSMRFIDGKYHAHGQPTTQRITRRRSDRVSLALMRSGKVAEPRRASSSCSHLL